MILAEAITAELPGLRAAAEALMVDAITFAAPGAETFDPDTGEYVTTPGADLYAGPCQVQVTDAVARDVTAGEQEVVVERILVKIPWDAPQIPPGSVGTITAVGPGSGSVVGRRYRVTGTHAKTYATAQRLPCELVTP